MDYDYESRALARCEADYLREPDHSECDVCGAPLESPDTRCEACDGVRVRRSDSVEGMPALPDDIEQLTPERVRAEVARVDRLREHDDEKRADDAERLLAFYVLRAIAREGHPLAIAAVTPAWVTP